MRLPVDCPTAGGLQWKRVGGSECGRSKKSLIGGGASRSGHSGRQTVPPRYGGVWGITKNTITWRHGMGTRLEEPNRVLGHLWEGEVVPSRPWGACVKHSHLSFGKLSRTVFRGMAKREAELEAGSLMQGVLREQ